MLNENSPNVPLETEPAARELTRLNMGVTVAICASCFVMPGLGHILMGRWIRGILLAVAISLMFLTGLSMQGELYSGDLNQSYLRLFGFFADAGIGLMYWLAEHARLGAGNMSARTYDYGTAYLWVCGLLNYVTALDAFDIARGRKP